MKYILNNTPIKTTNGFLMNNVMLDLDIVEKELSKINIDCDFNEIIRNDFDSKIGLKHSKYREVVINIDKDSNINISSDLDTNYLVSEIIFNIKENTSSKVNIIINGEGFNNLKLVINALDNSNLIITLINNLSKSSKSFIAFENDIKDNSNITINFIDLGGDIRISNYYSVIGNYASNNFNNIHIGKENTRIDMNYHMVNRGIKSNSNIEICGSLFDECYKTFKGIIDFEKCSSKAIGYENENSMLFSDKCISRSLPMLLCHEEDVSGTHSVSIGKVDENKLFYLMSKGLSQEESNKLIMFGNFNKILNNLNDKEEIIKLIEEKMN